MKTKLLIWILVIAMLANPIYARGVAGGTGGLPLLDISNVCPDGYHFSDINARCESDNPAFSILDFNSSASRPIILVGLGLLGYYFYKRRKK